MNDWPSPFIDKTDALFPDIGVPTSLAILKDIDNDGDLDVLFSNWAWLPFQQRGKVYINALDVLGRFVDATFCNLPLGSGGCSSIAVGNVDGDGDLDLVTCFDGGPTRVFINKGSQ